MAELSVQAVAVTRQNPSGKWARIAGGWTLLVVGLLGFVLPVIPGIPLVLAGLALLAKDYAWARLAQSRVKAWVARVKQKLMPGKSPAA